MKLKIIFSLLVLLLTSIACDSSSPLQNNNYKNKTLLQGKTMGTRYNIILVHPKEETVDKKILKERIDFLLQELNQKVSTYITHSKINQFNQTASTDPIKVDSEFFTITKAAQNISEVSNGAFDITISPLIDLWGFGAKARNSSPTPAQIQTALANTSYQSLVLNTQDQSLQKTNPNLHIDLSAIAKGYAVDKISEFLRKKGFANHLVEIGGELKASGLNQADKKWRIAIEQPDLSINSVQNGLQITNRAVATSGDYRNYFVENGVRRSHIIDPKTAYPIKHNLASVTVLHKSAMYADAYATAILVMGEKLGKKFTKENNLDVLMIIRNEDKFEFWSSSNLFISIFTNTISNLLFCTSTPTM